MPVRPFSARRLTAALAAAVALGACTRVEPVSDPGPTTIPPVAGPQTPPAAVAAPVPVPVAATGAATPAPPPGLGPGASSPEIQALEQRLSELRYDPGKVDGVFDATTGHAVMAFQKVQGLARSGRATPETMSALSTARVPDAMLPGGGAQRVEIDLRRQVLFLWQANSLVRILPVSTGTGKRYCVDGSCARAVTPGGSFRVGRKILGLRVSRLGKLYNPLYFNGGIAIHGSTSVPGQPASHGCVRIPMSSSLWFFHTVGPGTPVYVLGGPHAPVPFNEQAPGEAAPAGPAAPAAPPAPAPGDAPAPAAPPADPPSAPPAPPPDGLLPPILGL